MVLKYGEINVFHNTETESYKNLILRLYGTETWVEPSSKIIIIWADNNIPFDIEEKLAKRDMEFKLENTESLLPSLIYVKSSDNKIINLNYTKPFTTSAGTYALALKPIFAPSKNYLNNSVTSYFNFSYHLNLDKIKRPLISCVRVKSTEEKPRFLIAYETDYLTESDAIYIINCLFRNQY